MLRQAATFLSRRPNARRGDVAKAIGVSRATFHRHFAARGEPMRSLENKAVELIQAAVAAARLEEGDCASAVRRLAAAVQPAAPYLALMYSRGRTSDSSTTSATWDQIDKAITGLFQRGQDSGQVTDELSAVWLADAFCSLMVSAEWAVQSGRVARRDVTRMVADTLLCGAHIHR